MAPPRRWPTGGSERRARKASTAPSQRGPATASAMAPGSRSEYRVKSSRLVEGALHAGLKGRNGFGRHFLSERCKLLGLRSEAFDLLAHVRNRQLEELGRRCYGNQAARKVEGGIGIVVHHFKQSEIEVGTALGGCRHGPLEDLGAFFGCCFRFLERLLSVCAVLLCVLSGCLASSCLGPAGSTIRGGILGSLPLGGGDTLSHGEIS